MAPHPQTPDVADLDAIVQVIAGWQHRDATFQLHPGDIGWFWRGGEQATAAALRVWRTGGDVVAIGMLDEPDLLRLAIRPDLHGDRALADRLADDLTDPATGVLPVGEVFVELPPGAALDGSLQHAGWQQDERWTILIRDLAQAVPGHGLRIERAGAELADTWAQVHFCAFTSEPLTPHAQRQVRARWDQLSAGSPYADAATLLGFDDDGAAVAAVIVWAAGEGRLGILEPLGVHRDHRGRGYGRAISLAAAAELSRLGAASAGVATPCANQAAVATYAAAGFQPLPERVDRRRPQ